LRGKGRVKSTEGQIVTKGKQAIYKGGANGLKAEGITKEGGRDCGMWDMGN